jgi:hypothetical protein
VTVSEGGSVCGLCRRQEFQLDSWSVKGLIQLSSIILLPGPHELLRRNIPHFNPRRMNKYHTMEKTIFYLCEKRSQSTYLLQESGGSPGEAGSKRRDKEGYVHYNNDSLMLKIYRKPLNSSSYFSINRFFASLIILSLYSACSCS